MSQGESSSFYPSLLETQAKSRQ